jgi:hypothetical protein
MSQLLQLRVLYTCRMEDICTRLGAARPLETEARDGSHRRLCGGQDLLKPILIKHKKGQIRSQRLIAEGRLICRTNLVSIVGCLRVPENLVLSKFPGRDGEAGQVTISASWSAGGGQDGWGR